MTDLLFPQLQEPWILWFKFSARTDMIGLLERGFISFVVHQGYPEGFACNNPLILGTIA